MEFVQGSLGFLIITSEIAKWSKSLLQHPKKVEGVCKAPKININLHFLLKASFKAIKTQQTRECL